MAVTIQDVAKKAGVSVATVSRVMNANYPVKKETRQAVLDAVKELNYIPNIQAKELTKKQSTSVGVIVPSINNMFFTELIAGIEAELKKYSLSLILACSNGNADEEIACVNNFIGRNTAGIIVASPSSSTSNKKHYKSYSKKMPFVFINAKDFGKDISYVSNDETAGTKAGLNYLKKHDRKNIVFVRGKDSYSYDIKEKVYYDFMKLQKEPGFTEQIINIGNGNSSDTVDNTMNIFTDILKDRNFNAVFACNDLMAAGVLNACKKLNIKVPEEIAIIGYDNIALSRFLEPKLTTIDQNMSMLGTNAAQLLKEKIDSENKISKKIILNNSIIERETV